jgi:hypothetical protein
VLSHAVDPILIRVKGLSALGAASTDIGASTQRAKIPVWRVTRSLAAWFHTAFNATSKPLDLIAGHGPSNAPLIGLNLPEP